MMYNDLTKCFDENEIKLLTVMINSVNINNIEGYFFKKAEIYKSLNEYNLDEDTVKSLNFKQVIKESVSKICKNCCSEIELCECEEKEVEEKIYYKIEYETFMEYFIKTFCMYYKIELKKIETKDKCEFQYSIENSEIVIQISIVSLQKEFCNDFDSKNKVLISIMPIDFECNNLRIYEWHEVLNKYNIDSLKIEIRELSENLKNKDFYFIDAGDDISIEDIENMRMVLRKYLLKIGFDNFTENEKYRPEYIKYSLPTDKIKECFIKDNYKIFILKPTEKQLSIAYFENSNLGQSGYLHDIIKKYDLFVKAKIDKLRRIKFLEVKSDKSQKLIQLIAPVINLLTIIAPTIISLFVTNRFIDDLINIFNNIKLFSIIYISVNIFAIIFAIIYTILPYFLRTIFSWERGLSKIVQIRESNKN